MKKRLVNYLQPGEQHQLTAQLWVDKHRNVSDLIVVGLLSVFFLFELWFLAALMAALVFCVLLVKFLHDKKKALSYVIVTDSRILVVSQTDSRTIVSDLSKVSTVSFDSRAKKVSIYLDQVAPRVIEARSESPGLFVTTLNSLVEAARVQPQRKINRTRELPEERRPSPSSRSHNESSTNVPPGVTATLQVLEVFFAGFTSQVSAAAGTKQIWGDSPFESDYQCPGELDVPSLGVSGYKFGINND